ncbi:Transmembrane protein 33 [Blastocladiella emersonii ATCC 22665]|nr:Transmembrane protein 33 [Blastocladiella emersonii ATCC 22665]
MAPCLPPRHLPRHRVAIALPSLSTPTTSSGRTGNPTHSAIPARPIAQQPTIMSNTAAQRLLRVAKHPQFAWFVGHLLSVIGLPAAFLLRSTGAYYRALLGAMVAYGVVLYRQHAPTYRAAGIKAAAQRMATDLNAHYFILAFFFYLLASPCTPLLVPFAAFSIFHCIGYTKDMLLPAVFPPGTAPPALTALATKAGAFSAKYQPQALHFAAYWEITATPLFLAYQLITFSQAIIAPLVYFQFVMVRYLTSATTRSASSVVRRELDTRFEPLAAQPNVLSHVGRAYLYARDALIRFADSRMAPPAQPAPAAAAAAAAQ